MRQLTFKSFLKLYLIDVSGQSSISIHKLMDLSKHNYRIVDPLILYCLFENKMEILFKYLNKEQYNDLSNLTVNNYLDGKYSNYSFKKIHNSYTRRVNIKTYDNEIKIAIRNNILDLMKEKKISKYRIYTDLKLNPGNINDFLSNNNPTKAALKLVKRIYNYCLSF